jgi:hypothetical protein
MGKEIIRERSCELKGVKRETGDGTSDQTLIHLTMGPHGVSRHFLEHEKTLIVYPEFHCNISDLTVVVLATNGHLEENELSLSIQIAPNIYAVRVVQCFPPVFVPAQRILPSRKSNTKARSMLTHIENALNAFQV